MKTAMIVLATIALLGCGKQPVGRFQLLAGEYEVSHGPERGFPAHTEKEPGIFLLDTATGNIWQRVEVTPGLPSSQGPKWIQEEVFRPLRAFDQQAKTRPSD